MENLLGSSPPWAFALRRPCLAAYAMQRTPVRATADPAAPGCNADPFCIACAPDLISTVSIGQGQCRLLAAPSMAASVV